MGCCCAPVSESEKEIHSHMLTEASVDNHVKKLLLLGSGSSGKSTLFKQLKCIHGWGLDEHDFFESGHYIRQNCVTGILKLIIQAQKLCNDDEINQLNEDSKFIQCVQCLLRFKHETFHMEVRIEDLRNIGATMDYIWRCKIIQSVYKCRGSHFSFPDNMSYFFNICLNIFSDTWIPSAADVLKCRIRTTGMVEITFEIAKNLFNIYDVGGQRNERKKWIHSFENVTAVIFVAALNHFDAVLFEDETKNAMLESLQLFDEICNSKWFKMTAMILFLNKSDLFEIQIRSGVSLKKCFNAENRNKKFSYINLMIDQQIPDRMIQQRITKTQSKDMKIQKPIKNIKLDNIKEVGNVDIKQMKVNMNRNINYANESEHKMEESLIDKSVVLNNSSQSINMECINIEDIHAKNIRNIQLEKKRNLGWNGTIYDGIDYHPIVNDTQRDNMYFKKCFDTALNFITDQYLAMNMKNDGKNRHSTVFVHITNACDEGNVRKVFWDTQNIIITGNIAQAGFN